MNSLRFAYASFDRAPLPFKVDEMLHGKWDISHLTFEDARSLGSLPDFTWLDFGAAAANAATRDVIKHVAALKPSTSIFSIFISGMAPESKTHDELVRYILTSFARPESVDIDLRGDPDIRAALLKFDALRHVYEARIKEVPPASVTPRAVHVPNADLRSSRGRLSIKLVAGLFGLPMVEIGRIISRPNKAALSKTPDAGALQEPLQPFADIALLRSSEFDDEAFRKWLRTKNEHMQNRAPLDWIREGRVHDVGGFAYGILTGQPS